MLLWVTPGPRSSTRNKKPKTMKMSGGSSMGCVCACMHAPLFACIQRDISPEFRQCCTVCSITSNQEQHYVTRCG